MKLYSLEKWIPKNEEERNSLECSKMSPLILLPVKWVSGISTKLGELGHAFHIYSRFKDKALGPLMFKESDVPSLSSLVPQPPLHLSCSLELVYLILPGVTPLTVPFLFSLPLNLGLGWRIFHLSPSCCLKINSYYYSRERQSSSVHEDFFPEFQAVLPLIYETRVSLDNACGKTYPCSLFLFLMFDFPEMYSPAGWSVDEAHGLLHLLLELRLTLNPLRQPALPGGTCFSW